MFALQKAMEIKNTRKLTERGKRRGKFLFCKNLIKSMKIQRKLRMGLTGCIHVGTFCKSLHVLHAKQEMIKYANSHGKF